MTACYAAFTDGEYRLNGGNVERILTKKPLYAWVFEIRYFCNSATDTRKSVMNRNKISQSLSAT